MNIVIGGEESISTQDGILILDDDNNRLFAIKLDDDKNLAIFGISRSSYKLLIEPRAINSIVVKAER